jgi:hypothetical protein
MQKALEVLYMCEALMYLDKIGVYLKAWFEQMNLKRNSSLVFGKTLRVMTNKQYFKKVLC